MQHAIDIPAPAGADNETVSTALETAALFRSKGDGQEAMRWLRRAAESAGEAGDDERALLLSRVVADLHDELETTPIPSSAVYPPPPSARSAQPASSSFRASHPPPPSSRASRPPPTGARSSTPSRPSSRPSYVASTSSPPVASVRPTPDAAPSPAASAPEPARVVTLQSVPAAAPLASPAPTPTSGHTKGARHAARVQIEISTTKPGVFEARLLADGESARIGSTEALLVLLDPASHLLER